MYIHPRVCKDENIKKPLAMVTAMKVISCTTVADDKGIHETISLWLSSIFINSSKRRYNRKMLLSTSITGPNQASYYA